MSFVVLDEADEMLNMGFTEELDAILERTPKQRRTRLSFPPITPKAVARTAATYMNDHVEITAGRKNSGRQHRPSELRGPEKDRYPALKRIIDYYPDIYGLIFCRTRNEDPAGV
ncbi:MAG: hypothetical protein R2861_16350 [Desulfobacterales bacterium]